MPTRSPAVRGARRPVAASAAAGAGAVLLPLLLVASVLAAVLAPVRRACADDTEDLRREFVAGDEARWRAILKRVESSPARIGELLGPLLRDLSVRSPSAFAAAWLCERAPREEAPLLVEEILRRAEDDEGFVVEMRSRMDAKAWGALVEAARLKLLAPSDPEAPVRTSAAWLLRFERTTSNARDLVVAWSEGTPGVSDAARRSLDVLLAYRFASPAAARTFFEANDRASFVEWVLRLSERKDDPSWPLYARMIEEAAANVERADGPAALARYLSPTETPWPEVRRLAARRAAVVPSSGDAWLPVLEGAFALESDRQALRGLLELAKRLSAVTPERGRVLARGVLERLRECCLVPDLTLGLLDVLGIVGDAKAVREAFDILSGVTDATVQERWLAIAGRVGGNVDLILGFHAARVRATDETTVRLRIRAIEALARHPDRGPVEGPGPRYLRSILRTGAATSDGAPPTWETLAAPRRAAVLALEPFPSPETVTLLTAVARRATEAAEVVAAALDVLVRLAPRNEAAASALIAAAREGGTDPARVAVVRALGGLGEHTSGAGGVRLAAAETARAILATEKDPALRQAALVAAGGLGDAGALRAALDYAADLAEGRGADGLPPVVAQALEHVVRAAVQADRANDAVFAAGVARLAAARAFVDAVRLAEAAADSGEGRVELQVARAAVLRLRADAAPDGSDERRGGLIEASRVLKSTLRTAREDERDTPAWARACAMNDAVLRALLRPGPGRAPDPATRKGWLLSLVETAVHAGDAESAARAAADVAEARRLDLTPAEAKALDEWAATLERRRTGATPR